MKGSVATNEDIEEESTGLKLAFVCTVVDDSCKLDENEGES